MAIQYVGGVTLGRSGSTSTTTQSLTGLTGGIASAPAAGDFVIVTVVKGSQNTNTSQAVSGYTTLGTQLFSSLVNYDTSLQVSYKWMSSTPDTSITIPSTGSTFDGQAWAVMVFRGVDPTTPFDVASVQATGDGVGRPDPAAITPSTAGSWVLIAGGCAALNSTTLFTAPTNFTTDFLTANGSASYDASVGMGYWDGWTSGAVDPGAYGGGSATTADSWAAWTIALRAAVNPPVITGQPAAVLTANEGTAAQFSVTATNATTYQWQISTDGGVSYTDVSTGTGGTTATYTTATLVYADNYAFYRCVINGSGGLVVSTSSRLRVISTTPGLSYISLIGSATGTNTLTLPAHQAGDLVVLFAYREITATLPTIPAGNGWLTAGSGTTTTGGATLIVYKLATSSAETVGTFTNATSVIAQVYRGADSLSPVGPYSQQGAILNGTVVFPALSPFVSGNSTSRIAAFYGTSAANSSAINVSGLTRGSFVTDATDTAAGYTSTNTVNDFSQVSATLPASFESWRTGVIEIRSSTVAVLPIIEQQPQNVSVDQPNVAQFSVGAVGVQSYQWQVSANGGTTWSNVSGGSGANTATYTTDGTTPEMSSYQYRVLVTNTAGTTTSNASTLTVTAYHVRITWAEAKYAAGTASLTNRRALVLVSGALRQVSDAQIGTGLQPVVLMTDGSLKTRATSEGTPIILIDGQLRTLNATTEQLQI